MSHITREKLKKILDFNENHDRQVENCLAEFEHRTKLVRGCKGFITYAKALLSGEHLEILQIPLKDKELGAIYYNINSKTYIVLNTSLNLANNNFALAHELFHMYFHHCYEGCTDTERYLISYHDNEEDLMANAFAGRFLMPDDSFGQTCHMAQIGRAHV